MHDKYPAETARLIDRCLLKTCVLTQASEFDSALADLGSVKVINGAFDVEIEIARIKIAQVNVRLSKTFLGMHSPIMECVPFHYSPH